MTGASSGIGEAMVRLLAEAGVPTVVVARRADRLEALAAELPGVEVLVADLATEDGVALVAARLSETGRPIELLVNNAGFGNSGLVAELDPGRLAAEVRVNVLALTTLSAVAARVMVERGRGWILNVSSVAGFQAGPGSTTYAATKAFVTSFTEGLHEELRGTFVRVTALCPGFTRTEFQQVANATGTTDRVPSLAWMSAEAVAATGLADVVKGRTLSIPGLAYKATVATSSLLPRALVRRLTGLMLQRDASH